MTAVLAGRVALVTGASGGIGAAICRELASRGAAVAAAYGSRGEPALGLAGEIERDGGRAVALGADMADPAAPSRLVAQAEEALGPLGVLVACHGLGRHADWRELSAEDFDRMLAINLRAPFLLAQAALPGMCERSFGRVLFISSVAAFRGGVLAPDYAASKAGLHGLAHFLASRVARDGVTVNVLAPGFVATEMLPGSPEELARNVPVGRVGEPQEIAAIAAVMLENAFMTSQAVAVDGGVYPR